MDAIDTIYQKYEAKDYWGNKLLIERKKNRRDHFNCTVTEQQVTDRQIAHHFCELARQFCHRRHAEIQTAISLCDIEWLKRHVRYDQSMSLDLFELITGQKVKRLSNKKLAVVFEEVCKGGA